jgi:hypothetical protein
MRAMHLHHLPLDYPSDLLKPLSASAIEERFGFLATERANHLVTLRCQAQYVKH